MEPGEQAEREIIVRGERCRVTALRTRGTWTATGTHRGKPVEVHRAATPDQAFEWWTNKAQMQTPDR